VPLQTGGLRATQGIQKLWGKWCKILHSGSLLALRLKARKHYIYIMNIKEKTQCGQETSFTEIHRKLTLKKN